MSRNLRILHCLRAPVGGLFRHVVDLATEQARLGHDVGIIYDELTSSPGALETFDLMAKYCRLGIRAAKMPRLLGPRDYFAYLSVKNFAQEVDAQVLHGHGGKGGAYARLAAAALNKDRYKCISIYTPHGGSLHYSPDSLAGKLFLRLEKDLVAKTSGLIFESAYSANIFDKVIGRGFCPDRVIPNGLREDEFQPVVVEKHS